MDDSRIGTKNADGKITTWPKTSLSGQPYRRPHAQVHRLDNNHFVVFDLSEPRGFDRAAALEQVTSALDDSASKAETVSSGRRTKNAPVASEEPSTTPDGS